MSRLNSTLRYLYGLQSRGMKFGLENIQKLLSAFDNPHKKFLSVHIAGTNGKGSTAAMIAAILTASGYKTGLYTSPHLVQFSERMRIDGREISEQQIVHYTRLLKNDIEKTQATFFEATTAIAFQYFAENTVDIAVIETGLGGRLDATNVVKPLFSIITSIGFDHTDILGKSIKRIAREKGGIIKKDVPCLVGTVSSEALTALKHIAIQRNAKLVHVSKGANVLVKDHSLQGIVFDVITRSFHYKNLMCSLAGNFQKNNILLALASIHMLRNIGFEKLQERTIKMGLADIRKYSGIRGRLEIVSRKPLVVVDVAHNPDAIRHLVQSLRSLYVQNIVTIFGAMKDKDVRGMVTELQRIVRVVIAVSAKTPRAMEPGEIVHLFHAKGGKCIIGNTIHNGIKAAFGEMHENEAMLVTGSHYVVGEFLQEDGL